MGETWQKPGSEHTGQIWACYALLGAGILAPWNAFLTAIDYYAFRFPGAHVDRLFTVAYLPTCLLLLVALLWVGDDVRWLPKQTTRIPLCYVSFTLVMAAVPLADALTWAPGDGDAALGSQAALVGLLSAVVVVGALDGACQGAVFGDAACHAPLYAQAVAAGTACSGLLVSLLRLACKAAWQGSSDPVRGLRASTALYFLLSSVITGACAVVYWYRLPALHAAAARALHASPRPATVQLASSDGGSHHAAPPPGEDAALPGTVGIVTNRHGHQADQEDAPLLWRLDTVESSDDRPGSSDGGEGSRHGALGGEADEGGGGRAGRGGGARHVPPATPGGITDLLLAHHAEHEATINSAHGHVHPPLHPHVHSHVGSLHLPAHGSAPLPTHRSPVPLPATSRPAQLGQCWSALWPYCASLVATYTCTLAVFPGFLTEDIHNDALGDWYPLLVITLFNAADMAGKLLGPTHTHAHDPSHALHTVHAPPSSGGGASSWAVSRLRASLGGPPPPHARGWSAALSRTVHAALTFPERCTAHPTRLLWLSVGRGVALLAVFAIMAALHVTSPVMVLAATFKLGATNGWLTVAAMSGGPLLVPSHLAEAGENLLVCALATGLTVGAACGWLWLLV